MKVRIFHLNKAGERTFDVQDLDEAAQLILETSLKKRLWIDRQGARGQLQSVIVVETWHNNLVGSWMVRMKTEQDLLVQLEARLMMLLDDHLEPGLPDDFYEAMRAG